MPSSLCGFPPERDKEVALNPRTEESVPAKATAANLPIASAWQTKENGVAAWSIPEWAPQSLQTGLTVAICTYKRPDSLEQTLASLSGQDRLAEECLVIDATPDRSAEDRVLGLIKKKRPGRLVRYLRVETPLRGLTRQRNLALRLASRDLIVFFDDDVDLDRDCLRRMEEVLRGAQPEAAGVGGWIVNQVLRPDALWRTRRLLGMVGDLRPGSYQRSGMSVPWGFETRAEGVVEGDWLPGVAMMWRTEWARQTGFCEHFSGYAQGEDLEFSLRMRRWGRLLMALQARLRHLHEPAGRPDHDKLGYMAIHNRYYIHLHGLPGRTWRDQAWFAYAWGMDSLLLGRLLLRRGQIRSVFQQWTGRLRAARELIRWGWRRPSLAEPLILPRLETEAGKANAGEVEGLKNASR